MVELHNDQRSSQGDALFGKEAPALRERADFLRDRILGGDY